MQVPVLNVLGKCIDEISQSPPPKKKKKKKREGERKEKRIESKKNGSFGK